MKKFNQKEYIAEWRSKNMMRVSATYKNEFVLAFREACQKLGISQAEVIRNAMQETIYKAKKQIEVSPKGFGKYYILLVNFLVNFFKFS